MLLDRQVHVNTHHTLIADFDKHLVDTGLIKLNSTYKELVLQINKNEPSKEFAETYFSQAQSFLNQVKSFRESQVLELK